MAEIFSSVLMAICKMSVQRERPRVSLEMTESGGAMYWSVKGTPAGKREPTEPN